MPIQVADGRYDRQELISWWNQDRLRAARVLVVGAGALGNELLKNFALVGVGNIDVIDLDTIESSNLSRCVLFSDDDEGSAKAEAAAAGVRRLNPEINVTGHVGNVMARGVGWFSRFDLVVAGLDNREARAWIGGVCRRLGVVWIDGAIEGLRGIARTFVPEGPCYECTLGEVDRQIMSLRRSCTLLSAQQIATGHTPTTATTSSVIAAVEAQEAIKILSGRPDLLAEPGSAFVFLGETLETYRVRYEEDEYCLAHDSYAAVKPVPFENDLTPSALSRSLVPTNECVAVEFEREIVIARRCLTCKSAVADCRAVSAMPKADGQCPECDAPMQLDFRRSIGADDRLFTTPFSAMQLPPDDIVTIRSEDHRWHVILEQVG
ncbi:MAG: hypothetical protein QOK28_920 [Actinomycetota bacterium]